MTVPEKIPKKKFLARGKLPIVSQEAEFVNGFWDDESAAVRVEAPVVVYGDHTQVIKLVDFDFVVGADGVKILKPKQFLLAPFLRYFLEANPVPSKGYARHFRHISELHVPLPSADEQKRIVAVLDQAFAALDRARTLVEANLADADAMLEASLMRTFDGLVENSPMQTLAEAAHEFGRGKSRHRPRNDPKLYGGPYPFVQTGDVRNANGSLREWSQTYNDVGLAQSKLWPAGTVCITIAANIAETAVLEFEGCFPDSVIGMVPDPEKATPYYVEYMLRYFSEELKRQGKGSAQDNINMATFENARFPFPPLSVQRSTVETLDAIAQSTRSARREYRERIDSLMSLRQSLLQKAFSGQLI